MLSIINKLLSDKNFAYYLIIVAFTFILYGNTLNNKYNIDDNLVVEDNVLVEKGISAIPEIFTTSYKEARDYNYGYRPIAKAMFAIEYEIFGKNPFVGHLINLLLYALTGIILFIVLKQMFKNYNVLFSFFVVLLFLSHPLHTEVVASLKNREEILSFLAGIISVLFILKFTNNKKILNLILCIFFMVFAYLSKESALVFAALIPLILYYFTNLKVSRSIIYFVGLFILIFAVRKFINIALPANKPVLMIENPLFEVDGFLNKIPTALYSLGYYIKLLIFPHPLRFYYGYNMIPVVGFLNIWVIISIIVHVFLLIIGIKGLKKKTTLSFSIFFYLISISMFANILVQVNGIIAERLTYIASLGFIILIVYLIFKILKIDFNKTSLNRKNINKVIVVVILILIPYTVKTIDRNNNWYNTITLVEHDIEYLENSFVANEMYATKLLFQLENPENIKKNIETINKHYSKCLELYPDFFRVWNNLGFIQSVVYKQYDKAIPYFEKAIELNPDYSGAYYQLGFTYEMKKEYERAVEYYEKAIEIEPKYIEALSKLANWSNKIGDYKRAIELNRRILKADSRSEIPFINVGNYFYFKSDFEKAIKYWKIAIEQNPDNYYMYLNIGNYYKNFGDMLNADYYYNKAQRIQNKLNRNNKK